MKQLKNSIRLQLCRCRGSSMPPSSVHRRRACAAVERTAVERAAVERAVPSSAPPSSAAAPPSSSQPSSANTTVERAADERAAFERAARRTCAALPRRSCRVGGDYAAALLQQVDWCMFRFPAGSSFAAASPCAVTNTTTCQKDDDVDTTELQVFSDGYKFSESRACIYHLSTLPAVQHNTCLTR